MATPLMLCAISLYIGLFMSMSKLNIKLGLQAYLMLRFIHKNDGSIGVCKSDITKHFQKLITIPKCLVILNRLEEAEYIEKRMYNKSAKSRDTFYLTTQEGDAWLRSGAILSFTWTILKVAGLLIGIAVGIIGLYKFLHKP